MLLDMLTADAAAKHGHEYSPALPSTPPAHHPAHKPSLFSQSPFSILHDVMRRATPSPAPSDAPKHPADSLDASHRQKSLVTNGSASPAASPSPSRPVSSSSNASADGKPKKRSPRPKTTYNLAQPPPITGPRQKLHIRPKVLLQLHQVVPARRPKPVYEVIPFSLLAPRSNRRLARTFYSRDRLGPNDLLVVKAEDYGKKEDDEKTDDERWGARDVVGVICPAKKDDKGPSAKTELLMEDGSNWEVTHLPNGGYEFCYTDDHGLPLRSRWVPKAAHARKASSMSNGSMASPTLPADDRKFNFSTISASSRRHPVIATLGRTSIDVLDSYRMPTATSPPTPSHPETPTALAAAPACLTDMSAFMDSADERLPVKTEEALRRFILVSGVWVAFSENWSQAYNWARNACPAPLSPSPTVRRAQPHRTVSMSFIDSPRSTSPSSTVDESRRSLPRIFRTGTQKLPRKTSSTSMTSTASAKGSPASTPVKTRGRRANSTGTADLYPRTGSTRKRFGLALEDQTLPETEEERQSKRSIELLRIRELALSGPSPISASQDGTSQNGHAPNGTSENGTPLPTPIQIIEPPMSASASPPLASPTAKTTKHHSAYNPVTTAGLWDSGVVDGPGSRSRPTSTVVVNEKKEKAKRKRERERSREVKKEKEKDGRRRSDRFKERVLGIFSRSRKG